MEESPALSPSLGAVMSAQKMQYLHRNEAPTPGQQTQSIQNPSCLPSPNMPRRMRVGQSNPPLSLTKSYSAGVRPPLSIRKPHLLTGPAGK